MFSLQNCNTYPKSKAQGLKNQMHILICWICLEQGMTPMTFHSSRHCNKYMCR